jgi:hypothetical protein
MGEELPTVIAVKKLSMKMLDERLRVLEEEKEFPLVTLVDAPPEWLDDVLRAVIGALYQARQQGAYNMAKELEAKYFPDGLDAVGDELTTASGLKRSGG